MPSLTMSAHTLFTTPLFQAILDNDDDKVQAILGTQEGKGHVNVIDILDVSVSLIQQKLSCPTMKHAAYRSSLLAPF